MRSQNQEEELTEQEIVQIQENIHVLQDQKNKNEARIADLTDAIENLNKQVEVIKKDLNDTSFPRILLILVGGAVLFIAIFYDNIIQAMK